MLLGASHFLTWEKYHGAIIYAHWPCMALSGSMNLYFLDIPTDICFFKSLFLFHNYLYNCTSYNHVKTRLKCSRPYVSHGIMRQMIILKTFQFLWTRFMENRRNSDQLEKGLTCVPKNSCPKTFHHHTFLSVQKLDLCHIDQKMTLCFIQAVQLLTG